ncbi:MAG: hypothetical protein KF760_34715 [Candidatus Eremiobacteraeota bacterium]|nr:hypothetical protein [Candidatus Eremiobacteraeota bacterium]MCW5868418.1 hypothetical protein [Candidatus Eremiobacteraeota bacterium]
MDFVNEFEKELCQLSPEQGWVLQVLGQHRSALLTTLVDTMERARTGFVAETLEGLRQRGLAECSDGIWRLSWKGTGVANWREQKVWIDLLPAGMRLPEPRPGENGSDLGPDCDSFRAALFAPGRCWCGRGRTEHRTVPGEHGRGAESEIEGGSLADG